jgi:hypothetical protein
MLCHICFALCLVGGVGWVLLRQLVSLADELPEVVEMDLNPVIVSADGVLAVDLKVRCAPGPAPLPPDFRRMRV